MEAERGQREGVRCGLDGPAQFNGPPQFNGSQQAKAPHSQFPGNFQFQPVPPGLQPSQPPPNGPTARAHSDDQRIRETSMVEVIPGKRGPVRETTTVPEVNLVEWFQVAGVEKRTRSSTMRDETESGEPRRARQKNGQSGESSITGKGKEPEHVRADNAYAPPCPAKTKKMAAKGAPKPPIRMMKGVITDNIVARLRDTPVAGLSWGSLLDLAPAIRRDVAKALVQEKPPGK